MGKFFSLTWVSVCVLFSCGGVNSDVMVLRDVLRMAAHA